MTARKSDAADARAPEQGGLLFSPRSFALRAKNHRRERPQGDAFSPRTFRPRPLQFEARNFRALFLDTYPATLTVCSPMYVTS